MVTDTRAIPTRAKSRSRWRHVASRIMQGVIALFIVSILIFVATQALPGDVARVILGNDASPERLATVREQLGLDAPLLQQYLQWLGGVLHGDFGDSLVSGEPVTAILGERVLNSVTLSVFALIIMFPLSLVIGVFAAQKRDKAFDKGFLGTSMVVNATPEFVLGTVLIALLGTTVFTWLPPVSLIPPGDKPWWHPAEMVLPVATLVVGGTMYLSRLIRVSFIDAMSSEYIQTARLKGLSTARILFRHALPNALAPAIPAASIVAAFTVGGVVVVEYLFAYPGIGSELVQAVGNRDVPMIQATILLIAATYFILNFVADVLPAGGRTGRR